MDLTYPVVTPRPNTPFEAEDLGVILVVVPERFRHVFYDTDVTEFACMTANYPVAMEGLLTINCGATTL